MNSSGSTSLRRMLPRWLHELLELIYTVPEWVRLQAAIARHRPDVIYERSLYLLSRIRPKMGFAVPLASWLRGPLKERVRGAVLGDGLAQTGLFDPGYRRQLFEQHQPGRRDHSAPLWSLLMFDAFVRQQGGSKQESAAPRVLSA